MAHAQYSLSQEFSKGFSLLRFEPAPAGDRFFGVRDGYVPGNTSSRFRAAIMGNVPVAPLLSRTDNRTGKSIDIVSKQFVAHLDVSYIATRWLLLNADLPLVVSQSGDGQTSPSGSALGDTRLGLRFGLIGGENKAISIGPSLDVWLPTGSTGQLTGDGHLRAQPMFTVSGRADWFVWSAGAGVQLRRQFDSGSQEIGTSWVFGAAAGVLLLEDVLQFGVESYGSTLITPLRGTAFDAHNSALEALFGARVHARDFVFGAALGPGLGEAPGSAPRVLFNVAFAPQLKYERPALIVPLIPDDRDQDGIVDGADGCPDEKGPARDDPAQNGCPDVTPLPRDRDDDGISDSDDACPNERGSSSDDKTKNGCPVAVVVEPTPPPKTDFDETFGSADAGPAEVTFAGFRTLPDGRAVVTIELSGPIAVQANKSGDTITYTLLDTRVPIRNNRNPLLTSDFPSSIVSAALVADKKAKSARLVLVLRDDFQPKHRLVKRNGGAALEIELPARASTSTSGNVKPSK
ncbi:MAG: hypothetical protein ABW061_23175 [Polyangiaceae bacterium]